MIPNQSVAASVAISSAIDWDGLDLQKIIEHGNQKKIGGPLTAWFIEAGYGLKPEVLTETIAPPPPAPLIIDRIKSFDPASFIASGLTIWRGPKEGKGLEGEEEQDARSLAITEIDFTKLTKEGNFLDGLETGESYVTGEVKRARLIVKAIQADARIGQALYEEDGQKTLRFLYDTLGLTWIEFLGTTLRHSNGNRYALYLYRSDFGSWLRYCLWLDRSRFAFYRAFSLAS